MAEDLQVQIATAKQYLQGASDLTVRKRLWLAMMERYGRLSFNHSGYDVNWDIEYSEPGLEQFGDGDDVTFPNHRAYKQMTLDWRGYKSSDSISLKQRLMNRGELAIVDLSKRKLDNLRKGAVNKFHAELFVDGNATGNENRFCGLPTFQGAGTCAAGDLVAVNSDSYAGLNTAQQFYGGNWSTELASADRPNSTLATDWPHGSGDPEYDALSAKLVNYTSTGWPSGGSTWLENCVEVLRATGIWCACTLGEEDAPQIVMLPSLMYSQFKTAFDPTLRTIVPHKESQDLGFGNTVMFEGMSIHFEFNCPAATGHVLNPNAMELKFMTEDIFETRVEKDDIKSAGADLMFLYTFGNFCFTPKYFAKLAAIA
jgi:hypothetical protein